ncbi:MAG: transporter related protein [Gemmatimonadetes bacterium]|nr:transporter related protein [Gemmatimonadota bacterium]
MHFRRELARNTLADRHQWTRGAGELLAGARSIHSLSAYADIVIAFDQVGKRYRSLTGRQVRALEEFTLELHAGEVFGLAGPNGAGKSTLIALLMGFLAPSEGTVRIEGLEPRRFIETHGIGYLSELVNIPPAWRLRDALRRYALLAGVPARTRDTRVDEVIELLGLDEHRGKRVRQLSKGNLQRLGLAQSLLCDERVIVLDEPTHGLDPVWTGRFRDVVNALRRDDRLILIASHNLDELARLADRVGIMDRGRLQRVVDVRAGAEHDAGDAATYRITLARGAEQVAIACPTARDLGNGEYELADVTLESLNATLAALVRGGALVSAVQPLHSALEQQFRDAVGAGEEQR